jgi:hypothetical protein
MAAGFSAQTCMTMDTLHANVVTMRRDCHDPWHLRSKTFFLSAQPRLMVMRA